MTSISDSIIETTDLTKRYAGRAAVDHLSLAVPRGTVFGLLGPNGAGKTTTIGMLLGLIRPTSGKVSYFGGESDRPNGSTLRRIGAIVETPSFYSNMSGRDNLRYFQGIGKRGHPRQIDELLEQVDLLPRADNMFKTYSLGMKQRLGIAFALLGDPEVLFLDEPTNGLDPAGVVEVRTLVSKLGASGKTIVISSHNLYEIEQVCDYVAILSHGRMLKQGKVEELLSSGAHVRVHTTDDGRALDLLSSLPQVVGVSESEGFLLVDTPVEESANLTRALAERQIYVTEMHPVRSTLEHFFLEVTDDGSAVQGAR